jgi:branched-subunit amino acid aminotransferase/4-amino-4-deoxychorismate lyase
MPTTVWLNGDFVDPDKARVSAFDAGVQHAVGLFETMRAQNGRVLHLWRHLARIQQSARELGLSSDLRINPLAEVVRRVVEKADLPDARVRLTITGGDMNLLTGNDGNSEPQATILVVAQPSTKYPDAMFERGIIGAIAEPRLNPLDPTLGHKTINYWMRLRELQIAAQRGGGEAIFLSLSNHLAGGAVSNLFLVRGGVLLTPIARGEEPAERGAIRSPVLPGVTRSAMFEFARTMGVETRIQMLSINDLLDADEAFLTNSSWGVLPLTQVEAKPVANAAPGEVTKRLRAMWLDALATGDEHAA